MRADRLWVVMPVFNEEASVGRVLGEWLPALRALGAEVRVLALNDGSTDGTLGILRQWEARAAEITVADQPNAGHGQTCMRGYRAAIDAGADWVLQIDSDGQCDPRYLAGLWAARRSADVVMGFRVTRGDGLARWVASRVVSLVVLVAQRVWVADPNVPYRLIRASRLAPVLDEVPPGVGLANVLLAARLRARGRIRWIPIGFRERHGGSPSVRSGAFLAHGLRLYRELRAARASARSCCGG